MAFMDVPENYKLLPQSRFKEEFIYFVQDKVHNLAKASRFTFATGNLHWLCYSWTISTVWEVIDIMFTYKAICIHIYDINSKINDICSDFSIHRKHNSAQS